MALQISVRSPPRVLVESEKGYPDKSVLSDGVIGGSLQRAFAFCFSFAVLERCWKLSGDGGPGGPINDNTINAFISLLEIRAENWATTARIKEKWQDGRKKRRCKAVSSFLEIGVKAAGVDALRTVLSNQHAVTRMRSQRAMLHVSLGLFQLRKSRFLRLCGQFNFAGLAMHFAPCWGVLEKRH